MRQVKARSGAQEGEVVEIKFGRRNQSVTNVQLVMPSEQLQQSFTTQLNSTQLTPWSQVMCLRGGCSAANPSYLP